jgi:hypothetical protein
MRYLAVLVVVLGSLVPCQAQNLLPNPEFDHDVSGWRGGLLTWDPTHSAVGPGGSGLLTTNFGVGGALGASVCVPVKPGVAYSFGGRYLFPFLLGDQEVGLTVTFTSDAGCLNLLSQSSISEVSSGKPVGQWLTLAGPDVVAPAKATAASFTLALESTFDPVAHAVNFDNLYFIQGDEIPALSLPGLFVLALGLGAAAVWMLRRRLP